MINIIIFQSQKEIKAAVQVVPLVFFQGLVLWEQLDWSPLLLQGCSHLRNRLQEAH